MDKSLSKVTYQYLMYEYLELLPAGVPDIAGLDWRMFGLEETEDTDLCNNTQGEPRKAGWRYSKGSMRCFNSLITCRRSFRYSG